MRVIHPKNGLRIGLSAVLLGVLACVAVLLFQTPGLNRAELIRWDVAVCGVRELLPGEEMTQSVYLYREFDEITFIRAESPSEGVMGLEISEEGETLFSGDLVFAPGETERAVEVKGRRGTAVLRMINRGKEPLSLPLTDRMHYDIGRNLQSEDALLLLRVVHFSDSARWTCTAAALILFLLSLAALWGWGADWNRRKAVLFILALCLVYALLFPAWNINDFGPHFGTSYSYVNTLLGTEPDESGSLMIREGDMDFFAHVLSGSFQSAYRPTVESYDNAFFALFQPSESNRMVPFTRYQPVHREYGPWSYIPYILGILLARLLSLNLATALFMARLLGTAACVAGIWVALRKLPERMSVAFTVLSCVPMSAMNLTAISYDGPCYVAVLCFFAFLFSLREKYTFRDAAGLMLCSLILGLVKRGAYAPFILALPLLLAGKDRTRLRLMILCAITMVLGVLINYRNVLLGRISLYTFSSDGFGTFDAKWAAAHPLQYLVMMIRSYLRQPNKLAGIIGRYLAWNQDVLPEFICALFYLLLFLSSVLPMGEADAVRPLTRINRLWIWLPVTALILLLPATMLSYTFLTSEIIDGPQGRYYLPVLIPLMLLCHANLRAKFQFRAKDSSLLLWGTGCLSLLSVYYIVLTFLR